MKLRLLLTSIMMGVLAFGQNVLVPFSGSATTTDCSGTFQDHAGNGNYSNYASGYLVIDPSGNGTVSVTFSQFALESCCDYVRIYDGVGLTGTLLGTYNGYTLPNSGNAITSTSDAITIRFTSDYSATYPGFTGTWTASGGSGTPSASFTVSNTNPLFNAPVQFTNTSNNQVVSWDFGDGNTSTDESPLHTYTTSGSFFVKQVVSNCTGQLDTSSPTTITVQAAPNGAVSVDTVQISVPCGGSNSTSFSISNNGVGTLNYNLSLVSSAQNAVFTESFEGSGIGSFTNQNALIYSTTTKTTGAAHGNQYLEMSGDGNYLDGLVGTFSSATPEEIGYYVRPESSTSYNGNVHFGQQGTSFSPIFYSQFYYGSLRLYYRTNSGYTTYYNLPASIGTWYHVQVKNIDYVNYTYDVYVNGALIYGGAKFYNYVSDINRVHIYSQYQSTFGIDGISLGGQDFTSAITYAPSSGTLANGNSNTIFINASASGLFAGTYWMDFTLSSNDTALDGLVIPLELTVTGDAAFFQSATCINKGAIYTGLSYLDSVMIWNNGCDTLNFTSIASSTVDLSGMVGNMLLPPYDTTYAYLTFTPTQAGMVTDSLFLISPDTSAYICINASVSQPPVISTDSTAYNITYNGCPDTVSFPFTIYNNGSAVLNWGTSGVVPTNIQDNFEGSTFNTQLWNIWGAATAISSTCGAINGNQSLTFYGSGTRYIETKALNTSAGGNITFDYSQSSCDYAENGEGIYVYYSLNGSSWIYLNYFWTSTTGSATIQLPLAAQGQNVYFKLQQNSYSCSSCDAWTIDDFTIGSGVSNSMVFAPDTGAVASGDSIQVLAKISTLGLASGTHNLTAYVVSNDPVNPLLTIPVTLTINGVADLVTPSGCVVTDSIMEGSFGQDSVMFVNDGCADLYITNMVTQTSNFVFSSTTDTIAPGDTVFAHFTFGGLTTPGYFYDTLSVISNNPLAKVCLTGYAFGAPEIDVDSSFIQVTLNSCSDSAVVPLTIYNTGQSDLSFLFDGSTNDTIKILALSMGYYYSYYNNAMTALNAYMQSPFTVSLQYITSASTLTTALEDYDVLWIPPLTSGQYSTYSNLSTAIQAYINNGGRMVSSGTGYMGNIYNMGILSGSYYGQDNGGFSMSVNSAYANHPVLDGLSSSPVSANKMYYYSISNTGARVLLHRTGNTNYAAATEVDYGQGKVIHLAHDFAGYNTDFQKLLANSLEHYGQNGRIPDWLIIAPDSGTVAVADSIVVELTFKANGNGSGVYNDTIQIQTNDPFNPIVNIPVQLTINGTAQLDVPTSCTNFDSVFVGVTQLEPAQIFNGGCDTLVIDSTFSQTGLFGLDALPVFVAPGDSATINLTFTPDTIGYFADSVYLFSNADPHAICVNGFGKGAPVVYSAVDTMRVTVNKCDGFKNAQFKFENTGYGALNYDISIASIYNGASSQTYSTTYAVTNHQFTNTPTTADTIFFMVVVNGDYNYSGSGEYYTFSVENYNIYSIADNNVPDGSNDTSYGYYTGPNIATWLADGQLDVKMTNGYGVSPNIGTNLHYVEVWMKSSPSWMTLLSSNTGSLNASSFVNKNVLFTVNNLPVGTYTSNILIESNDPVNPNYNIPVVLNVVDKPTMELASNIINYGQVLGSSPVTDSVKVYNTGCKNLTITNLQFLDPAFTSSITTATLAAKDSMWLPITLTPSSPGSINSTVILTSNDTTLSVALIANVGFVPVAGFDFSVLDQCDGKVQFSDLSSNNPYNWNWDFGDGQMISNAQNPTHTYQKPGVYNVQMVAFNAAGSDTISKLLNMNGVLYGGFSLPDSIFRWDPVQFYDSSQVATSWQWYFGDGNTSSVQNPTHTYTNAGTYFLTLVVSNPSCTTTVNQQVVVYEGVGIAEENFGHVNAYPVPTTNIVNIEWDNQAGFTKLELIDVMGRTVYVTNVRDQKEVRLDIRDYAAGTYMVKLQNESGHVSLKRIVLKK